MITYFVHISPEAQKKLDKLDKESRINIFKKIEKLKGGQINNKDHIRGNLFEFYSDSHRVYYFVFRGMVVISDIVYDGKILIKDVGTKNTQKKDIKRLCR